MSTSKPQATSLQRVVITFDKTSTAKHFWNKEIGGKEAWSSTVAPSTAYTADFNQSDTITFVYDKSRNNFVPDLTDDHLHPNGVTLGFEDIKAWAVEMGLNFKSVDATAIRFHK